MKIFIACSKHFYSELEIIKEGLEKLGHEVALLNSYEDPFKGDKIREKCHESFLDWVAEMIALNDENLGSNDAILVVNLEKDGKANYLGGATFLEVTKAWELGKRIYFWNPLPEGIFHEELLAFRPKVINKDLELIEVKD